eukprot:4920045-Pyramimonas_sp.AAC.1
MFGVRNRRLRRASCTLAATGSSPLRSGAVYLRLVFKASPAAGFVLASLVGYVSVALRRRQHSFRGRRCSRCPSSLTSSSSSSSSSRLSSVVGPGSRLEVVSLVFRWRFWPRATLEGHGYPSSGSWTDVFSVPLGCLS